MLTLRELLRDLDVAICAGEESLDVPVRWVHITELTDPTPWLSGGELLLTTGLQLDSPEAQSEFVHRLADHQLAGLGVGTGFGLDTVPRALIDAANERNFPVFEVPYEVPFIAITEQAFSRLVNEQYAVLRRSIAAHERLERLVLSERGLDAVVGALSTLVGGTVLVFDARGEPLVRRMFRREPDAAVLAALSAEVRERARQGERRSFTPSHADLAGRALALPVAATGAPDGTGSVPQAWLVAVKDAGGLAELDRLTLHQAVTIVALELLRRRVAEDTERRLAGDILSALVAGDLAGSELARRLEPFGLAEQVSALVLARPAARARRAGRLRGGARDRPARGGHGRPRGLDGLGRLRTAPRAGGGRRLRPGRAHRRPRGSRARGARPRRRRPRLPGTMPGAPSTRPGARSTPGSSPARRARTAPARRPAWPPTATSAPSSSCSRCRRTTPCGCSATPSSAPSSPREGAYGGELMRSLEAFIEENGQWERAAKRLYCHRHTLRYRIRKVEDLTGRDLSTARDRIEFWLALRGREIARPHAVSTTSLSEVR